MPKKLSGLGRGLDELLEDNAPNTRSGGGVIIKANDRSIDMSATTNAPSVNTVPKSLYDELPKNRSIKSNFKK